MQAANRLSAPADISSFRGCRFMPRKPISAGRVPIARAGAEAARGSGAAGKQQLIETGLSEPEHRDVQGPKAQQP